MSARRRIRDDYSSDEEAPARRSFGWRDIQAQQRASGKVLQAVEGSIPASAAVIAVPPTPPAPAAAAAAPKEAPKALVEGLIASVPSPVLNGAVASEGVAAVARALKEDGVKIAYVGSLEVGEALQLTGSERKTLFDLYARELGAANIIVNAQCAAIGDTVSLVQQAAQAGARAVVVGPVATGSCRIAVDEALEYLVALGLSAQSVPLLLQYNAAQSCFRLGEFARLAASRGALVRGAIFNGLDMTDYAAAKSSSFEVILGSEENIAAAAMLGANAFVSPAYAVAAPLFSKIVAAGKKGDVALLGKLSALAAQYASVAQRGVPCHGKSAAAAKTLISLRCGVELGCVRPPAARCTVHERTLLSDGLAAFVTSYSAAGLKQASAAEAAKPINVKAMDGYNGRLNGMILERIAVLESATGIRNLRRFFPHLSVANGAWRKQFPSESNVQPAKFIDHTILKAEATAEEVEKLCSEAVQNQFFAVCVNGCRVAQCVKALRGTNVKVAAVIGFPLGAGTPKAKAKEARELVEQGASEIDMVMNVGAMKDKNYRLVYEDIKAVVDASAPGTVKVIFETCLLTQTEIADACILSVAAGAAFVKTSTGFNKAGATPEGIDLMLAIVGNEAEVKASGGVRDFASAAAYISAGVTRIGTSSGVAIIAGKQVTSGY